MTGKKLGDYIANDFMDHLYEGESTISDASLILRLTPKTLYRVAARLEVQGLIASHVCRSRYGRPEVRWFLTRTRKAA